jgi:hypothetical protein
MADKLLQVRPCEGAVRSGRSETIGENKMKTREPPAKLLILLLLTGGTLCSWSQSTIAYSAGPAFQTPAGFLPVSFDLDQDGSADFGFMDSGPLCTTDVPCSLCTLSFDVLILGTNGLLVQGSYAAILPAGEWIGPVTSSNGVWSSAGNSTLLSLWWSERYGTSSSTGPLPTACITCGSTCGWH